LRAAAWSGFAAAMLPCVARAGAWTQARRGGIAAFTYERYRTTEQFDRDGTLGSLSNDNGEFVKESVHLYAEYGLFTRLTAFANLFCDFLSYGSTSLPAPLRARGFSDEELGLRYGFLATPIALAAQASLHVPAGYDATPVPVTLGGGRTVVPPALGSGAWGTELRLAVGKSFGQRWTQGYVNGEVGYNMRRWTSHEDPTDATMQRHYDDQLNLAATVGYKGIPRTEVFTGWSYTNTLGDVPPGPDLTNPLVTSVYDLQRVDVTAVVRIWRWIHGQVGAFFHVAGNNIGAGNGFALGTRVVWP
jgi:hypothetical protein